MNKVLIEKLKFLKPSLQEKYGIEEFAVFGSVARGEETKKNDIDIVILKAQKKNYFDLMDAKYFLEDVLKKKVDIGYFDAIRPIIRRHIEKELISV
ncbi:nucleotidyltransferase family protein [Caminibacter sp.]